MGHWGTSGLFQHPPFSDAMGKIRLSKKDFHPLKGWQWDGKWTIDPERCLLFDPDAGHNEFMDEVFENEARSVEEEWGPAAEQYTDIKGRKHLSKEEMEMPAGWRYQEPWTTDINRAVDENGWEYGIIVPPDKQPKSWNPSEKMYHNHRRRRWVRSRVRTAEKSPAKKALDEINAEGWEYAPLFGWKFHVKQQKTDAYRRRRWRRIMIPEQPIGVESIFKLEGSVVRQ
uniref:Myoferlin-like n=1 Tax=Callorhinchus milii TaxID=7868 RepID=A0A4W3H4B5_CALMI